MIPAFPKIFNVGTTYIKDLFDGPVEITEKVDGSQFAFGLDSEHGLILRSKGRQIHPEALSHNDMFWPAVEYVQGMSDDLPEDLFFYCEYLRKPKHNSLAYERVPLNNLCLFGAMRRDGSFVSERETLLEHADRLEIDPVPIMAIKEVESAEQVLEFMNVDSYLGGAKAEGVVIKNYAKAFLLGGQPIPLMAGKYVSEAFKEVHRKSWKGEHTDGGKQQQLREAYRTEARWNKAIQHLRDDGVLEGTPRDIGKLIAEIKSDITAEEKEAIKEKLWKIHGPAILRRATAGFPEFYKKTLLEGALS